jgi:putative ABC transport system substrate-binding protein
MAYVRRRRFLLAAGALFAASAVNAQPVRRSRVGVLLPATEADSEYPTLLKAFVLGLQQAGWTGDRNLHIDVRWAGGGVDGNRKHATELVALAPQVIMAAGASSTGPLLEATRTIPVVFTIVPDPVGAGFVDNLARPGGIATGFTSFDFSMGGKWLELLKEIAPRVKRVGVIRDSGITAGVGQWSAIQMALPKLAMEATSINLRNFADPRARCGGVRACRRCGIDRNVERTDGRVP